MEMIGQHRIPAPRGAVWNALNDPDVLRQCIPGCESLTRTADDQLEAAVVAKIGPVRARFTGRVVLSNIRALEGYTITGEGSGGAAGFAKGGADVRLSEEGEITVLDYEARAQVGGKLAQLGSRLVDGVARKMADEFFAKFAAQVSGAAPAPAIVAAPDLVAAPPEEALPETVAAPPLAGPPGEEAEAHAPPLRPARPEDRPAPAEEAAALPPAPVTREVIEEVAAEAAPEKDSWPRWGGLALGAVLIVVVILVVLSQMQAP